MRIPLDRRKGSGRNKSDALDKWGLNAQFSPMTPSLANAHQPTAIGLVRPYAETLAMVAASTIVGLLMQPRWGNSAVDLLYLPAVLGAAGFYGLGPGLAAAVGSALAFNFFFTQPVHTLRISSIEDIVTVAILFLVAVVTSQLAARMRREAWNAQRSASRNATVAGLARRLLSCSSAAEIGDVAAGELSALFEANALMLPNAAGVAPLAAKPSFLTLTPSDIAAAEWAMQSGRPAGRGTQSVNVTEWVFYPIRSGTVTLGALGLARDDGTRPVADDQLELLESLVDQLALAIERTRLEADKLDFDRLRESDKVRSILLSSIGQDLEPHLAAIAEGTRAIQRSGTADKVVTGSVAAAVAKLQQYLSNLLDLGPQGDQPPVVAGDVTVDLFHRTVSKGGEPVHLAPKEYGVLAELAKHPGRVLTHAHLLRAVWGPAQEKQVEYLRVAIRALRQKLEADPKVPAIILNEPAVGYRLNA